MANRIKIRRGSGTPTGSSLLPYEIGWSTSQRALYINNGTTDVPVICQLNSETIKGIPLVSGDNVDQLANVGVYYSDSQPISAALTGTVPTTSSGFRLEVKAGYGGGTGYGTSYNYGITQIAYGSDSDIKFRKKVSNSSGDFTNVPWQTIVTSTNVGSYALPITGGTLTGNLNIRKTTNPWITIRSDSMDDTATSITAETYSTLYFSDKNDKTCSYIQCVQSTSGSISTVIGARHRDSDGNNFNNYLNLKQNATSGSASVTVSHPAAWRSAIGAVNIAGDTMTGDFYVKKNSPSIIAKDPNGVTAQLIVGNGHQNHGIYSTGYSTDGTAAGYVSSAKWIIYRNSSGDIVLNPCTVAGELVSSASAAYVSARSTTTTIKATLDSAASGNHGVYSWGYWDGSAAHTESADRKWLVYRNTSGDVILNGNAASASVASAIEIVNTIPTTNGKNYYLNFTTKVSGDDSLGANSLVKVWIGANGASAYFSIGDSSHVGGLTLYSSAGKYLNLVTSSMSSSNRTITFPDKTGTVVVGDSARKIFVTTSASVPSGAVTGDIVLVKAS